MNRTIEKLVMLIRIRGRERDRLKQAWLEACQCHDECTALLARRQQQADAAKARYEAALQARADAPTDMLVADYSRGQQDQFRAATENVEQASDDLTDAGARLQAAKARHQRAQLRLDVLKDRLDKARRQENRRIARRIEAARPESRPAQGLMA